MQTFGVSITKSSSGITKMEAKKIFVLLPDGVGLRNFVYSSFYKHGIAQNFDIVYWNFTPINLSKLGYKEIRQSNLKLHPLTDIYKNARKHIELNLNIKKTNDTIYDSYRFHLQYKNLKSIVKNTFVKFLVTLYSSESGLKNVRRRLRSNERKTLHYSQCYKTLKDEMPAIVFCTNQRHATAIAPLLAASDLGIKTATVIFSWDNLPKATMVVETDYYFVWSDLMKDELLFYYPYISDDKVLVAGTPQFEAHYQTDLQQSREQFFSEHHLDLAKKYICFSGDDITTSPDDPQYLRDTAEIVKKLNNEGYHLGIIFRRCPVDFSDRYDRVVQDYDNIITEVRPKWQVMGNSWSDVLPMPEDVALLTNVIAHTELVINLGSSMVFDYAAMGKPCGYLNYNQEKQAREGWDIHKCYDYVHFRSMTSPNCVAWINSYNEIEVQIKKMLADSESQCADAKLWFDKINMQPQQMASARIWRGISEILSQKDA